MPPQLDQHAESFVGQIFETPSSVIDPPVSLAAARAYAAGRGLVGISVLDRQTEIYVDNGSGAHTGMGSASVIKVILAEELLHQAASGQIVLGSSEYARIVTMLVSSDDAAASSLYSQFGGASLIVAAISRHELKESAPPLDPQYWGNAKISAHDVTIFYGHLLDGSLPMTSRDYLLDLLRTMSPVASDGFSQLFGLAGLDPSWQAAVKQGWMCCLDGLRDVHTSAVLGPDNRYVVVILTEYSPALPWQYGLTTTSDAARLIVDQLSM